jgi:hypothetical protein
MHHVGEFRNYLEYFGKCLDMNSTPRPGLEDGLNVIAILLAMKTAIKEKRVVHVSEILRAHNLEGINNPRSSA